MLPFTSAGLCAYIFGDFDSVDEIEGWESIDDFIEEFIPVEDLGDNPVSDYLIDAPQKILERIWIFAQEKYNA